LAGHFAKKVKHVGEWCILAINWRLRMRVKGRRDARIGEKQALEGGDLR
jgi:hypothetical protein